MRTSPQGSAARVNTRAATSGGTGTPDVSKPDVSTAADGDGIDRALGLLCALPMALIVAVTFADVFARYLFASPIRGSVEIIEFAMALVIFTALPLVTRHRGHVSVSLIDGVVHGVAAKVKRVACDLVSATALVLMSWRLASHALDDAQAGTRSIVLQWPQAPLTALMAALAAVSAWMVLWQLAVTLRAGSTRPGSNP